MMRRCALSVGVRTSTQPVPDTLLPAPVTGQSDRAVIVRLVLGSALMLFLELALIRWLGVERRAPVLLLQLRAARLVPRHRRWAS